jgi:hypothetical protein
MENSNNDSKGDSFLKYVPLTSGILIYLGILNDNLFYLPFNIHILNYISFSEALVSSVYYFIGCAALLGIWYIIAKENNMYKRLEGSKFRPDTHHAKSIF